MAKKDFHTRLSSTIKKSHQIVLDYIHSLSDGEQNAEGSYEDWAPKDRLSHITYWNRRCVQLLSYISRGQEPPRYPDYEECNRQNYEENRDKSIQMLIREAETVQKTIPLALQRFSEEDLRTPGKNPLNKETTLLGYTLTNFYSHTVSHIADAYRMLGDTQIIDHLGDQMLADMLSLDDSPRARGTALYNRACIYALAGDTQKALEMFKQSLNYQPDLKHWAPEDSDLACLHEDPQFVTLVSE